MFAFLLTYGDSYDIMQEYRREDCLYSFSAPQSWYKGISLQYGVLRGRDTFRVCGASSPRCFRRTKRRTRAV